MVFLFRSIWRHWIKFELELRETLVSGLSIALQCRSRSKSKYFALSLIVLSLSAKGESGATVPFYNLEGNLQCALPIDTLVQTGRPSLDFEGYIQVTPSSLGSSACGNEPGDRKSVV